jgi:hypothetical protein
LQALIVQSVVMASRAREEAVFVARGAWDDNIADKCVTALLPDQARRVTTGG